MLRWSPTHSGTTRRGLLGALLAIAACLVTAGCAAWSRPDYDYSGVGGTRDNAPTDWTETFRRPNGSTDPFAVTNQGMQIEQRLGVR